MMRDPEFAKAVMLRLRWLYVRDNEFDLDPDGLPEFPEEATEGEPQDF